MSWYRKVDQANISAMPNALSHGLSVGTVIDTNDPQQMGRLRVLVPSLGDTVEKKVVDFPWATYVSPLAGTNFVGPRGPEDGAGNVTSGPVNYGMWNIPKVGAQVLVACIDGDPNLRVWLGCVTPQWTPHTMPHGRYVHDGDTPDGPLSSTEEPIQPLYDNMSAAYGDRNSFEFRSRGADQQVANINNQEIPLVVSETADDTGVTVTLPDGSTRTITQGYSRSRIEPNVDAKNTGGVNYDPQTYSWTTPGFHSISMNDTADGCRMRFRTTSGHQILLDDTNERIYIGTPEGNNWVEMDSSGNIDIHSERRISVHAAKDINFTTEETFRVQAKEIHLNATEEIRVHANTDISIRAEQNIYQRSLLETRLEADTDMHLHADANIFAYAGEKVDVHAVDTFDVLADSDMNLKTDATLNVESADDTNIKAGTALNVESGTDANIKAGTALNAESSTDTNIKAGGDILNTGTEIHFNGPPAASAATAGSATDATDALEAEETQAYLTNRVPQHEPWGRIMMDEAQSDKDDVHAGGPVQSQQLELNYNDPNVGKTELGETIPRGPNWKR